MSKLKLQAKFSQKEKSCFFHFGGSRKTPYRKPLETALDLFRKCGQRNATLEITRLAGDIGGGSSADKRVAARDEFPGMKLRVSSLHPSLSCIGRKDFQLRGWLTECKERQRLLSRDARLGYVEIT